MKKMKKTVLSMVLASALCIGAVSGIFSSDNVAISSAKAARMTLSTDINAAAALQLNTTYTFDYNGLCDADLSTISWRDSCYAKITIEKKGYYTYKFVANPSEKGDCTFAMLVSSSQFVYNPYKKADIKVTKFKGATEKGTILLQPGTYYFAIKCDQYISGSVGIYEATDKEIKTVNQSSSLAKIKKVEISSISAKSKAFVVSWKKISNVSGYQIRYATKSSMKSAKQKKISNNKSNKLKVTGLKSKKNYYVQIRAYKTYNGKVAYGDWSTRKKVKTK